VSPRFGLYLSLCQAASFYKRAACIYLLIIKSVIPSVFGPEMSLIISPVDFGKFFMKPSGFWQTPMQPYQKPSGFSQTLSKVEWILANLLSKAEWILANPCKSRVNSRKHLPSQVDSRKPYQSRVDSRKCFIKSRVDSRKCFQSPVDSGKLS